MLVNVDETVVKKEDTTEEDPLVDVDAGPAVEQENTFTDGLLPTDFLKQEDIKIESGAIE